MIESLTKNKAVDSEATFQSRIVRPLEAVPGQPLIAVSYWILGYEAGSFSVKQPNDSGILFAGLHFEKSTIEISCGWEKLLRGQNLNYHIQALSVGQTYNSEAMTNDNLCEIKNVAATPWENTVGKRLTSVEVIGLQGSPQAIQLSFSGTDVVLAIGYAGSDLLVGDGDELLVFSGREWQRQKSSYGGEWESLWTASVTSQSEFLVKSN